MQSMKKSKKNDKNTTDLRMKFYEKTIKNLEFNSLLIPLKD
jgi:Ca-activated chloride channel family protein